MSPVPKKSRRDLDCDDSTNSDSPISDNSSVVPDGDPNSGFIQFEVDKVSTLDINGQFSSEVEVGGLPWRMTVSKDSNNFIGAFLHSMHHKSTKWAINVNANFFLVNSDDRKILKRTTMITYNHARKSWGFNFPSISWEELMNEEKGFIKDDTIVFEIRFTVECITGIWFQPRFGSHPQEIGIEVDGQLVRISKQYLSSSVITKIGSAKKDEKALGFIRFEIIVSDISSQVIRSPAVEVHGTPWRLSVKKRNNYLAVYFTHSKSYSNIWSINVSAKITLKSSPNGTLESGRTFSLIRSKFSHENYSRGFGDFIWWDDLVNEEKGFVKDGKITIEARFTLSNIVGIRTISHIDFADPKEPRHDVALVIEGQKVYVGKQILAFHSPFFNAMFYGNHIEKNKKEIELKEIDRKVFIVMLNLIYPSYQKINDDNAEPLLKMADYFQIKMVIDQVEQFFIDSTELDTAEKLKLSDQYRLVKLHEHCLDSFEDADDILDLDATSYKELSDKAKSALLDKAKKLR